MDALRRQVLAASSIFFICSSTGNANQLGFFISGGPDFSTLKNSRLVQINKDVTNAYIPVTRTNSTAFWGIGAQHTFEKNLFPSYQLSLGLAGYFFQLGSVKGVEYPLVNEGLFDTLHYHFQAKSRSLMVEAKAIYAQYALKPYVLVGVGPSWNKLYDYYEKPVDASLSAAPSRPFHNNTKQTFSYELGAGVQYQLWNDTRRHVQYYASAGYQYFNLNNASLGASSAQTSSDRLRVNHLDTQGFIATLTVSFG